MNRKFYKTVKMTLVFVLAAAALTGCGQSSAGAPEGDSSTASIIVSESSAPESSSATDVSVSEAESSVQEEPPQAAASALTVRFGDEGEPFTMHLYDNPTAAAIARHVGTADWRLPIYHYDDYDNWEVMQYYDIPSRYEIPSNPESVENEAAGAVYYSDPNRIVLFYQDAQVPGEYTLVGYFDYTEEFLQAVEGNPVLEGWGNKIINISSGE